MGERTIGIVCTPHGFGGLEMNTLKLAKWLQEAGWKVRLLVNAESRMYNMATDYITDVATIQQFSAGSKKASAAIIRAWLKGGEGADTVYAVQ